MKKKETSAEKIETFKGTPEEGAFNYINSNWDPEHIELNKAALEKMFKILLPGKIITFINGPTVVIDTETGTVLPNDSDLPTKKFLAVFSRRIKCIGDFNSIEFKSKYVYIYSVDEESTYIAESTMSPKKVPTGSFTIRYAEYNPGKKAVTFTIDESIYERFSKLSDSMAINKSKFVENKIREFVEKNG